MRGPGGINWDKFGVLEDGSRCVTVRQMKSGVGLREVTEGRQDSAGGTQKPVVDVVEAGLAEGRRGFIVSRGS